MADAPGPRLGTRKTAAAVAAITVVALAARLVWLDNRVAHWDEARVAWWQLDHLRTGEHEYRPIIHGPFLGIVNRHLFEQFGPTDVVMRLPVAVIGGLLPATAWLLRDRLGDVVTVALAAFLAANPLLLYYSRFVRNDVLVAAFMFAAFGCLVRLHDRRKPRYLYAALVLIALGFTTKENALLYVAAWIGAAGLLLDHRLLFGNPVALGRWAVGLVRTELRRSLGAIVSLLDRLNRHRPGDSIDRDRSRPGRIAGWKTRWTAHAVAAATIAVLVLVFFYAPREPETGLGLWELSFDTVREDPGEAGALLDTALRGSAEKFIGQWGDPQGNPYLEFLGDYVETMWQGAAALSLLAVAGLLYDRWGGDGPSAVVSFAGYWGLASVVGYPLATDIKAPWAAVHAVVALAIPAAIALGVTGRWTLDAAEDADWPGVAAGAILLLIVSGSVIAPAIGASYVAPTERENAMFQYAQPQNELRPVVDRMERVWVATEGTDVVVHGSKLVDGDRSATRTPACLKWFDALPLPWYLDRSDAAVNCTESRSALDRSLQDPPPVVITRARNNETVARALPSAYEEETVELRLWGTETSFFFRPAAA